MKDIRRVTGWCTDHFSFSSDWITVWRRGSWGHKWDSKCFFLNHLYLQRVLAFLFTYHLVFQKGYLVHKHMAQNSVLRVVSNTPFVCFSSLLSPFTKRKEEKTKGTHTGRLFALLLPSPHQLWSLVLICDVAVYTLAKKKKKKKKTNKNPLYS